MSAWKIEISACAEKDILALDRVAQKRLKKKFMEFLEDPIKHSTALTNSSLGSRRFRVGDYRVVFDVRGHTVSLLRVGHRREIYR